MDTQILVRELNKIFWKRDLSDDEVANEMLSLMDENKETIQTDSALNGAYRILNIWSRSETETGYYLDTVKDLLNFEESSG
ncbi:hypothetical protein [Bacillus smithii]|uniref:hypothetical protein n=1 Tax=Bacillus smithii TaxID=1479 RepID=UPI003D1D638B